jgi:hypothetical protein
MEKLIVGLLRVLCPHLRAMAQNTSNPIDDIVVNIICMVAGYEPEEKQGG